MNTSTAILAVTTRATNTDYKADCDRKTVALYSVPADHEAGNSYQFNNHLKCEEIFDSIEEVHADLLHCYDGCRSADTENNEYIDGYNPDCDDLELLAVYDAGKHQRMSGSESSEWVYESLNDDVSSTMNDEDIEKLVARYEADGKREGFTLDSDSVKRENTQFRGELMEAL